MFINKKNQILKKGLVIILMSIGISSCAGSELDLKRLDLERKDNYQKYNTPIKKAIAIGLHAPSAHNTQSWKFKIVNDNEALLYINEKILLPETDPPTRQIHMSAGCFLEALSIGSTGIGYDSEIINFPEGDYSIKDIGKKPVARIKLTDNKDVKKSPLWDSIFTRRTNRGVYTGDMISKQEIDKVISDTSIINSKVVFINESEKMIPYKEIFKKAMEIEFKTLKKNEETRNLFRFNDKEIAEKRDGLSFDAAGLSGISKYFAQLFTQNTKESWNSQSSIDAGLSNFNKGLDSSKGFFILVTQNNQYSDYISSGRDTYKLWLALTKNNIYIHPLNQANQEYLEMNEQRIKLDKLADIKNNEKIQMIARIGHGEIPFESYRKNLDDFIIIN